MSMTSRRGVPAGGLRRLLLPAACLLIAGFKLWLVAGDDIAARANPLDQMRYLEMAREIAAGRWLGRYDPLSLIREPGYPLWVAANRVAGLPLRRSNELLLLAAAAAFAAALRRVGAHRAVAAGVFALIALEPHSLLANRDALPAGFYLPLLLLGLAGLVTSVAAERLRGVAFSAAWAGIALGILWVTRPEKAILLLPLAAIAVFDFAVRRARAGSAEALRRGCVRVFVVACGIVVVAGSIAAVNFRHYGVFATTGVAGSGYLAANRALLGIAQDSPRRFVPVPRDARDRAYAVSPGMRELAPVLEGPSWARAVSCHVDRVCDDIGAGYFRWLLRDAAAAAGHLASPAVAENFFGGIAADLEAACERGDLPCRRVHSSFLHPYPSTWVPHLFASFQNIAVMAARGPAGGAWNARGDPPDTPARVRSLFDAAATRRATPARGVTAAGADEAAIDSDAPMRHLLLLALWGAHPFIYALLSLVGGLGAVALLRGGGRGRFAAPLLGVIAMLAVLVAARVALLVLVDASSFPARSSRYVYPFVSLYGCAMLLLGEVGARNAKRHRKAD